MLSSRAFWKAIAERAISTTAQTAVGLLGTDVVLPFDLDWRHVVTASLLAGLLSVLKGVAAAKSPVGGFGPSLANETLGYVPRAIIVPPEVVGGGYVDGDPGVVRMQRGEHVLGHSPEPRLAKNPGPMDEGYQEKYTRDGYRGGPLQPRTTDEPEQVVGPDEYQGEHERGDR